MSFNFWPVYTSPPTPPSGLSIVGSYLRNVSNASFIGPTYQPATLPDASIFSWVNQAGATETAQNGALLLSAPIGNPSAYRVASIGANTSLTAAIICTMEPQRFRGGGICFRESATSKVIQLGVGWNQDSASNFSYSLSVGRFTSNTTFASNALGPVIYGQQGTPIWFRLAISGVNLLFQLSCDGVNFITVWSETKTNFFTVAPDQWGYLAAANNTDVGQSANANTLLLSWLTS